MNKQILHALTATILLTSPSAAFSEVLWSCNAMAAQPAGIPIVRDKHESSHGAVRFKDGETGTISLICPVTHWPGPGFVRSLFLTYRDGDGHEGASEVAASFRRVRTSGPAQIETLSNGRVSSNDPAATNSGPSGWARHQSAKPGNVISHTPDFAKFYYYVHISLKRSSAGVPLGVTGAFLTN